MTNEDVSSGVDGGNRWRIILWGGLAALLSLPAIAMLLGAEGVDWSALDFVIMGVLMLLVGAGVEAMMRFVRSWRERRIAIGLILVAFLLVWAELAVGVFGTPFAGS